MKPKPILVCETCGFRFDAHYAEQRFCSLDCRADAAEEGLTGRKVFKPSEEEIRRLADEISSTWSDAERESRRIAKREPYTIPKTEVAEGWL